MLTANKSMNPLIEQNTLKLIKMIGVGKSGTVFSARRLSKGAGDDPTLAVKLMNREDALEIQLLQLAKHPNIAHFYGQLNGGTMTGFAMEYCNGGSLHEHLKSTSLSDQAIRPARESIAKDIISALCFLHTQCSIIHRDIKPKNIMLHHTDGKLVAKIVDLGTAVKLEPNQAYYVSKGHSGSYKYMPYDSFALDPSLNGIRVTYARDVYAFGLILYLLIQDKMTDPMPHTKSDLDVIAYINSQKIADLDIPDQYCTEHAVTFIKQSLKHIPDERPTAQSILNDMNDGKTLFKRFAL